MTRHAARLLTVLSCFTCGLLGCQADPTPPLDTIAPARHSIHDSEAQGKQVTVVIALSSIVPGGVIGHAGIAVDNTYWDYGPARHKHLQPLKSIRSKAGPWWDDPEQQWACDRTLSQVLADMPNKVHPMGSLVAIIQVQVTDEQAQAITTFWQDTYTRMHNGEDTYRLTARQCASMVAWSMQVGLQGDGAADDRLPRDLHRLSPTDLYEALSDSLTHTAGPAKGQPADVTLWQLDTKGFEPWQRPSKYGRLTLPELPRIRLAFERAKHLPIDLLQ